MKNLNIVVTAAMLSGVAFGAEERIVSTPAELVVAIQEMATNANVRTITLKKGTYDLSTITAMSSNGLLDYTPGTGGSHGGNPLIRGEETATREEVILDGKELGSVLYLALGDYSGHNITVQNLTIQNGKSSNTGGGINTSRHGSLVVTNCVFRNNQAKNKGGAVFGGNYPYFYDCLFETNKITSGYGLGAAVSTSKLLSGCTFRGNNSCGSAQYGGAAVCSGNVKDCLFDSNSVTGSWCYYGGGALYLSGSGYVRNCTFTNNYYTATIDGTGKAGGGALRLAGSGQTVDDCKFYDNYVGASKYGGALFGGSADTVITNCVFRNNRGWGFSGSWACRGGAIACCNAKIVDCDFHSNYSAYGGGVWECTNVVDCVFAGNRSMYEDGFNGGGAAYQSSLYKCIITNNYSVYQAGGLYDCKVYDSYVADNWAKHTDTTQDSMASHFERCTLKGRADGEHRNVFLANCSFSHSTITDMTTMYLLGGKLAMTNCLITQVKATGLTSISTAPGATIVNCTIASNQYYTLHRWAPGCAADARAVTVNTLFYDNHYEGGASGRDDLGECVLDLESYTNCCFYTYKSFTGEGCLNRFDNPTLAAQLRLMGDRDPDNRYAPLSWSVLTGAGVVQDWMTNATDYLGHDRLTNGEVAIGAYEPYGVPSRGLLLMVK